MAIAIEGLTDPALRRLIGKKLDALGAHLARPPIAVRVGFTDENGPKGGVGIRCALTVELSGRGAVHAEDIAATPRQAFDLAFEALERRTLKAIDRARDRRRRPKKYFAAKRLLESEAVVEPMAMPPRPRRSA